MLTVMKETQIEVIDCLNMESECESACARTAGAIYASTAHFSLETTQKCFLCGFRRAVAAPVPAVGLRNGSVDQALKNSPASLLLTSQVKKSEVSLEANTRRCVYFGKY